MSPNFSMNQELLERYIQAALQNSFEKRVKGFSSVVTVEYGLTL